MNVYELAKKVSPGIIKRANSAQLFAVTHTKQRLIADCGVPDKRGGMSARAVGDENVANARFMRHCTNNFMRALDELKAWRDWYQEWVDSPDPGSVVEPDVDATSELIAELESVE